MNRFMLACGVVAALATPLRAQAPSESEYPALETGKMWTFDVPPLEYWAKRFNFQPTAAWLDHARLAALRYGNGCSASFVSGDGLVMTNHHCVRACVESATREGEDLLGDGFLALKREEERPCQGLFLDQLQEISDVTAKVSAVVPAGTAAKTAGDLRRKAIHEIEEDCGKVARDAACQVVTMYRGGQYKLYRFRRFSDVRLVFAVESQTAFFGGDPDNFTYPRYDLDMGMVRAYVDSQPAHPEHFTWSKAGSKEGDLVFVVGNPGSTGRLNTVAQLEFLRDVQYPTQLTQLKRVIAIYHELSSSNEERGKALRNTLFGLENTQKAIGGYQSGLLDPQLMARKRAWERDFRGRVRADAGLVRQYGSAWTTIADVRKRLAALDVRRRYHAFGAYGSRLLGYAANLVRYPGEMAKPDSARLPAYQESNKAQLEHNLYSTTPFDPETETSLLTAYLAAMQGELPAADPVLRSVLAGRTPEAAAREMVAGTEIGTADQRKALIDGGAAAVTASKDPFVALARRIDPLERETQKQVADLNDREASANELVARALLAVFGNSVAPDATFSLRISDGEVNGYPMNGTLAPPYTTLFGLFDRSASFAGVPPFDLAPKWKAARNGLDLATPFNAVSTADIIGGNSGSPVINRDGEIVGLIFDSNIDGLPLRFLFSEGRGRSVWVDSRGILEALRKVYGAAALADEMSGK